MQNQYPANQEKRSRCHLRCDMKTYSNWLCIDLGNIFARKDISHWPIIPTPTKIAKTAANFIDAPSHPWSIEFQGSIPFLYITSW